MPQKTVPKTKEKPEDIDLGDGVKVELMDIEDIELDAMNPNQGTPRGEAMLDYSMDEYGPVRGIALDRDNTAMAGNKTIAAAKRAGVKRVVVVETDGETVVATRRRDMDLDGDDPAAREYTIMDNRAGQLGLHWDPENVILAVDGGADMGIMFYDDEYAQEILGEAADPEEDPDIGGRAEHVIPEMELQPFEHYDYLFLFYRTTHDWSQALDLMERFGLIKAGFTVSKKTRKIGLCHALDGGAFNEVLAESLRIIRQNDREKANEE